ncbi:hypothetical protein BvRS1_10320 [Burkholderia vietnamiensis]|nr:hypothetical protein BvRS1_10320 [Burkholderia vietnamiensis]
MEGARAGAGGALNGARARRPIAGPSHSKKPDRRAADRALSFGAPGFGAAAYRWVSSMYIWITTSGENVNGTQP